MSKQNTIKQCVLICEPINNDFQSASAFIKLGNVSVIDLCINWLTDHGIKEIFMFYAKSKNQIEEFVSNYQQNGGKTDVKMHLNYVKNQELKNFGDVMRQVQFRNIISQDFLILYADTVSNLDLSKAITLHFKKKAELKSVVLTTILRESSSDHKVHITNSQTGQILQMDEENAQKFTLNQQRINLKKMNVQFRRDLAHCDIYLCTVDVYKSFKENHQYANMFDFINGMLTSQVYQQKILGHVLQNHEHTFRTNKTKDYYLAYFHYISNHFSPYTLSYNIKAAKPNANNIKDNNKFTIKNFNRVFHSGVSVPRNVYISNGCYIGQKCTLGANSQIQKSILQRNVSISARVSLKNCIILDGCSLAQKSTFQNCLIQKVNQTQQIRRFKLFPKQQLQLIRQSLFQQTPPPQQSTFQQQLQHILSQQPQIELVSELNSIRKHHNRSLQDFTKEVIRILNPEKAQGMASFAQDWGQILLKIHENQKLLIQSLYYSCKNLPKYQFAFHAFVQYFFKYQHLKEFVIIQWYDDMAKKYADFQTLKSENKTLGLCANFVKVLKQRVQSSQSDSSSEEKQQESNTKNNQDSD